MTMKNVLLTTALFASSAFSMSVFAQKKPADKAVKNKIEITNKTKQEAEFDQMFDQFSHYMADLIVRAEFDELGNSFFKKQILSDGLEAFENEINNDNFIMGADLIADDNEKYAFFMAMMGDEKVDTTTFEGAKLRKSLIAEFEIDNNGEIKKYESVIENNKVVKKYQAPNGPN